MTKIEQKIMDWLVKKKDILFFLIITGMAVASRFWMRGFDSGDFIKFLEPWYETIAEAGGLPALAEQVGDYNVVYQFLIALFTYLPILPIFAYKLLSCAFDLLLGLACGALIAKVKKEPLFGFWFNITYAIVMMLPTVVMNSSLWAQCDSIYTFFLVGTLYFLLEKKDIPAFILYGGAVVFKFQAIFLLPFLLMYYLYTRRFSILLFLIPVGMLWLSGIPAYLYGRSLMTPFIIYSNQTNGYREMWMNAVSFWQLAGNSYTYLGGYATLFAMMILGIMLYCILKGFVKIDTTKQILQLVCWCLWTCTLFLPAMHERYNYPTEIFLLLLTVLDWKYIRFALPVYCCSLITYSVFLFGMGGVNVWWCVVILALWAWFTAELLIGKKISQTA